MTRKNLQTLRDRMESAGAAFDTACKPHYCDGRWGAYRAWESGESVPDSVTAAFDAYHAATHAFYLARDGKRGFLGSRGL